MKDGRHLISFGEYAAIDAVNASALNWYAKSPAFCRMKMAEAQEPTRAMDLGNAVHFALLEPDRFEREVVYFQHDGRTKDGKKEREDAAADGKIGLRRDDYEAALGMARSLFTHPRVAALWKTVEAVEQTALWTITMQDGKKVRGKARRDVVGPTWLADVKTAASIDRFSPWAVTDNGYYRQAAWYAEPEGESLEHFFFFVVQSSAPYESAVFRLADEALRLGKSENERLLAGIVKSSTEGTWPRHVEELLVADVAPRY